MKNVLRLLCGWMAIALAACTGDELQQIAPLQKPVGERVISVDAYTPSDDAHTRLDFEESTEGLKLSWSENDAFTAVIDNKEVTFSYDVNSKQFTATLPEGVALTDGIVAYYPAYTGEYSTDLSEQTGALNSAKTFMEGTYHAASKSFTFAHSTAILKATFSGLPQDAVVSSIKIGAAPYTISIPYAEGMDLANDGIYIYLPNVAKNENIVFSVATTTREVYTATQAVKLDEGIKVGTYYIAPITLTLAACNLPTGNDFNTAINSFLQGKELTQIKFIANSVNTDNSNPIGSSNAYMVANGHVLEIHTAAPKFVFNEDSGGMFSRLSNITTIDYNNCINTSNVTAMNLMFYGSSVLTDLDLSDFDTSKVTNMLGMFIDCSLLSSLDLSNFDTSSVTDMMCMFSYCTGLTSLNVRNFDTSSVVNISDMFAGCSNLTSLDVSSFNTTEVTDMFSMFAGCSKLDLLDLSTFNTENVTNMGRMFSGCSSLTSLDLSSFNFDKVENFGDMFTNLGSSVTTGKIPVYVTMAGYNVLSNESTTGIDNSSAQLVALCELPTGSSFNSAVNSFLNGKSLTKIKFIANSSNTNKDNQIGTSSAYMVAGSDNTLEIHTSADEFVFNADCKDMFYNLNNITAINFGDDIDTSKVTDMKFMFYKCFSLASLNLSNFDTSNVTDMSWMFSACSVLTSLDLSSFDTSKVMTMSFMFRESSALASLNLGNFNTSNVTDMSGMFYQCPSLASLNLSSFNTSNVTSMYSMFYNCSKLTSLDLSSFDTSKVTSMYTLFYNCNALTTLNVSSFNTSKVTNMNSMFAECHNIAEHDLSNFDFSGVTDSAKFANMFANLGGSATNKPIHVYVSKAGYDILYNKNTGINAEYAKYVFPCNLPTGGVFKSAIVGFLQGKNLTQIKFIANSVNTDKSNPVGSSGAYMVANGNVLEMHTATLKFVFNAECDDMFSGLNTITAIDFGDNVDTSNVTSMYSMFYQCNALTTLNVSSFNTSQVTNMSYMFAECHNMAELDLSSFDFGMVAAFKDMFYLFAKDDPYQVPVYVYVKNDNDKTLLESAGTGINSNYAIFMVE